MKSTNYYNQICIIASCITAKFLADAELADKKRKNENVGQRHWLWYRMKRNNF